MWSVYVLALALGMVNVFDNPARQSFISEMVPLDDLPNAVTLNSVSINLARVFGAALGGVLAAVLGISLCFACNAISFAAVLASLAAMNGALLYPARPVKRMPGQIRQGLRYVRETPELLIPLLLIALVGTLAWEFQVTLPLMASNVFGGGAASYGVMASVMGAGAVVGGLISAARARPRARSLCLAAIGWGIAITVAAVAPTLPTGTGGPGLRRLRQHHVQRLRQDHAAARGRSRDARAGHGAVGDRLAGVHADRRAARRLGRAGGGGPLVASHRRRAHLDLRAARASGAQPHRPQIRTSRWLTDGSPVVQGVLNTLPGRLSRRLSGMAATDPADEISELSSKLDTIEAVVDPEAMRTEVTDLREQAADPSLWEDQARAQAVTRRLSFLEGELGRLESLRQRLADTRVLFQLADDEHDQDTMDEATAELAAARKDIDILEVRTLLNGDYDAREALITINSQAGGADAEDFAGNLQRMYLRWAERHKYSTEIYDVSYGEAGIKSTTFAIKAPYAYGTLRGEQGTHRMVRISKYDNQGRRQTSFAGVDVLPVVEQTDHVDIPDDEIRVDVFRSSGPGGQGVNTTDSAVRITHLPTNIVVSCQNERSQIQNKASAMAVLQAKLLERRHEEEQRELNALRGDGGRAWGSQIRNYVLYPYQMVKDQRTGQETSQAESVLDGEIDDFIDAEIRWLRRGERDGE